MCRSEWEDYCTYINEKEKKKKNMNNFLYLIERSLN